MATMPPKKRNPVYSIAVYWPDFQSLNLHWNLIIFKKTASESSSSRLHASFDTFWVQIDRLRYEYWNVWWKHSFEHFLSKMAHFLDFVHSLKIDLSWNCPSIWTQRVSKVAWSPELQDFVRAFLNIIRFDFELGLWKSGQYSVMEWTGFLFGGGMLR